MKKILVFGSFDPLHEGHKNFLEQAKALGDHLTVVVAHDAALRAHKAREPEAPAETRLVVVAGLPVVDQALIGNKQANKYELLSELDFDVVALGYDQEPADALVREELDKRGKRNVEIVRLKAYKPEQYKSTIVRNKNLNSQ